MSLPDDGVPARLPFRPTIRIRLTLLYGGMFLMAGVVLLVLMYFFVRQAMRDAALPPMTIGPGVQIVTPDGYTVSNGNFNQWLDHYEATRIDAALNTLLRKSLTVLVCLAVIAFMVGYAMAGRVLRPLGRITRTAREVVSSDLHRRIQLDGPDDEL
ncbi:HAMP domain-containing protein, partial [Kitasatospora sp. NPDC001175]|uniref:HAMP domain-containing protein n=1 Tax=Kitasatospora sp. NPDC001175 TaxID=3157103 RepID=UPI003D08B051